MKLIVLVLVTVFVTIHGAAINSENVDLEADTSISGKVIIPKSLFESAWDHQGKLESLQTNINLRLTQVRTAVSGVLRTSSGEALEHIEANANDILDLDGPVRTILFDELSSSACVNNLRVLINGITEFTGFGSSNCVTSYDTSVREALKVAYELLQQYEGYNVDVQQIVVRSFIGKNAYLQPEEIENSFKNLYDERLREWNEIDPDIENFVEELEGKINEFSLLLQGCFKTIQDNVAPYYNTLRADIEVCQVFDNTDDPFAIFRQ